MSHFNPNNVSRRLFLQRASALTAATGSGFAATLATMGAAAAQDATDHKALVCVFLYGGNDQSNMIVPSSNAEYGAYLSARPLISQTQSMLLPISPNGYTGPSLGLAPELTGLKSMFDSGRAAIMANVGPLNRPTTITDYRTGRADLPTQLFSHSDMQGAWQTGVPDTGSATGWLGRVADVTNSGFNGGSNLSMSFSVAGNNTMQAGARVIQYQLTSNGTVPINALGGFNDSQLAGSNLRAQMTETRPHMFERQLNAIAKRSIDTDSMVRAALAAAPALTTVFPTGNRLASQLKMVARMISARGAFSQRRQVFFVSAGGYDFHDNLKEDQAKRMLALDGALTAFNAAMNELRIANQVTTFTASDFGRALQSNGRGSDHGWGAHHFVMGGAVQGKRVFGAWPTVALRSNDDVGQGRLLPSTSVDKYAEPLARWFGVPESDITTVLPNLRRFPTAQLGFLTPPVV